MPNRQKHKPPPKAGRALTKGAEKPEERKQISEPLNGSHTGRGTPVLGQWEIQKDACLPRRDLVR